MFIEKHLGDRRGGIDVRHYRIQEPGPAVVWVGGVGGGWDTPAQDLYPRVAEQLVGAGIASLRVRFRRPGDLAAAVDDVLAGLAYLEDHGLTSAALVGHSFGGAVVVQAGCQSPHVRTVVTLSTQLYGADASALGSRRSLLAVHGADDPVLPAECSRVLHAMATGPSRLVVYEGAGHTLDEAVEELHELLVEWIVSELADTSHSATG